MGCLRRFVDWRERHASHIPNFTELVMTDAPKGAGEKSGHANARRRGGSTRKTAAYQREEERPSLSCSVSSSTSPPDMIQSRLFTEIYHNENPFVLTFYLEDSQFKKKDKQAEKKGRKMQCITCHNNFPSLSISPYDLALRHCERWRYPDLSNPRGQWLVSAKETAMFYHIDPEHCLRPRHPYFSHESVLVPEEIKEKLRPVHQNFLLMHLPNISL